MTSDLDTSQSEEEILAQEKLHGDSGATDDRLHRLMKRKERL